MTTLFLAEDHRLFRQGLKSLLAAESSFRLAGESGDGFETLEQVQKLKPDVLLLDLVIPRCHGLEVLRQLPKDLPTKTIVVSMHAGAPYVLEALQAGALGYILKESSAADLLEAIRKVTAGAYYVSPPLRSLAINATYGKARQHSGPNSKNLTPRENLVLELAAQGKTSAEIGSVLFISPRTVETHRSNLMAKLGLQSQTDLVRYAIRQRIIEA